MGNAQICTWNLSLPIVNYVKKMSRIRKYVYKELWAREVRLPCSFFTNGEFLAWGGVGRLLWIRQSLKKDDPEIFCRIYYSTKKHSQGQGSISAALSSPVFVVSHGTLCIPKKKLTNDKRSSECNLLLLWLEECNLYYTFHIQLGKRGTPSHDGAVNKDDYSVTPLIY